MDEQAAKRWLEGRGVPRETIQQLDDFVALLRAEAARQNLVARSTLAEVWFRHIVDSAQLIDLAVPPATIWADIGTGAGFPGLVVALLGRMEVHCIEPRALRVRFLEQAVALLGLAPRTLVFHAKAEAIVPAGPYDVISARAVAPLHDLLRAGAHLGSAETLWLLPKGRTARAELEEARRTWQGEFRLVPSITDPQAAIVVARNVRPRKRA